MKLPKDCTVAVCDGEKLSLFRNTGEEAAPKLTAVPTPRWTTTTAVSTAATKATPPTRNPPVRQ